MKIFKNTWNIILIILIFLSCDKENEFNFYGKWQSLNESGFIIEIDENDKYTLYRNGNSFFEDLSDFEELKIRILNKNGNWRTFKIEDSKTKKEFSKGRIEIVNKDRVRIYFHKHHNILDLADEFHRTENLTSFEEIMGEIRLLPEKK